MFCDSCSKLSILNTSKKCMKCQGAVNNNISVICNACSEKNQSCSACFKKILPKFGHPTYKHGKPCNSCGK